MFGSEILDVALGVVFVFLVVSIICSAIREGVEAWLKTRAAYLERGIRELLHDRKGKGLARSFYEHPLIYSLYSSEYTPGQSSGPPRLFANGRKLPSYIPARNFALALMDIAARGPNPDVASDGNAPVLSLQTVRASIINIQNEAVQRALLTAIDTAQGDINRAQDNIQAWFDSAMDRVSGWYKRSTQWILLMIGLSVAILLNINTITIAEYLYHDDSARAAIVARAATAVADTGFLSRTYKQATDELNALGLPIGWSNRGDTIRATDRRWAARAASPAGRFARYLVVSIPGWLVTALAATFGAPFWFDLLNKMMVIRATVKPREKSPEEASEDRQRGAQSASKDNQPPPEPGREAPAAAPAGPVVATAPPPVPAVIAAAAAPDLDDGCDVPVTRVTRDEDLPSAEGGVA